MQRHAIEQQLPPTCSWTIKWKLWYTSAHQSAKRASACETLTGTYKLQLAIQPRGTCYSPALSGAAPVWPLGHRQELRQSTFLLSTYGPRCVIMNSGQQQCLLVCVHTQGEVHARGTARHPRLPRQSAQQQQQQQHLVWPPSREVEHVALLQVHI